MIQLIYLSEFTGGEPELAAILATSIRKNREAGVTGMLLCAGASILQVLEGEPIPVRATYERIGRDPRHKNLIPLVEEEIDDRHFDGWSMGFHAVSDADLSRLPALAPYFRYGLDSAAIVARPGIALELLHLFAEGKLQPG